MAKPTSSHTDESLAIRLQSGEIKALTTLIDRYQAPLLRYTSYLGSSEPEDIVQETFIKVYQNIQSFNIKKKFSSWIYRIAHNTGVSQMRSRRVSMPWEDYLDYFVKVDPEDSISKHEIKQRVTKCLSGLPPKYRGPLVLYYLEDKSYLEIMDILRLPMGTVSARINRAKKIIKDLCQKI